MKPLENTRVGTSDESASEHVRNGLTVLRLAEFEARQHRAARVNLEYEDIAAVCRRFDRAIAILEQEKARAFDAMLRDEAAQATREVGR